MKTKRLLDFMNENALGRAFVAQALHEYALKMYDAELPENTLIHPAAWRECAKEALKIVEEV